MTSSGERLVYRAEAGVGAALILAHGAGAGQRSTFMVAFARALSARGLDVVTFDFPYIAAKRRMPDRGPILEASYRDVIELVHAEVPSAQRFLFVGGKSMGGRIATQVAAADPVLPIAGLLLIGYPLHPPGRPTQLRAAHLPAVRRPMFFAQGSRDTFGTPAELRAAIPQLDPAPMLYAVEGGDHSLKVPGRNPVAQSAVYDDLHRAIVEWIESVIRGDAR